MNEILSADYSPIRNNPARPAAFLRPFLVRQAVAVPPFPDSTSDQLPLPFLLAIPRLALTEA